MTTIRHCTTYKPVVFVDCDMVLLDFNQRCDDIYFNLTGMHLDIKNPDAFKAKDKYELSTIDKETLALFSEATSSELMWTDLPAFDGAVNFVNSLSNVFDVIVLTSMNPQYKELRIKNLINHGFKIKDVIAVPSKENNPKEHILRSYNAVCIIDDLVKNLTGLNDLQTKKILFDRHYSCGVNDNRDDINIDLISDSFEEIKTYIFNQHIQ